MRVKQEETHVQRPWGNQERIRKVLLVATVEGAGRMGNKEQKKQAEARISVSGACV